MRHVFVWLVFLALWFVATSCSAAVVLAPIGDVTLLAGSPLHIPLDGFSSDGQSLTFTALSDDEVVNTFIPEANRSLRISVADYGDMVFELFEGRTPRATQRIIALAEDDFYDGLIFHRVIDAFVIQGGDPTGTGGGESGWGPFDDQFHVELQHNRSGVLAMAKAFDDTNDCQFYVAEGAQRHLDFNHSIFGQLVEGEDVREAISSVPVDENYQPLQDVVMQSVDVFVDPENAVLMLSALEGATGSADVTVTATDEGGNQALQTFHVDVEPDTIDSDPFLADIPEIVTYVDTPTTFQLTAIDVEGDPAYFLDEYTLDANGLYVPVWSHPDLDYIVDFYSGEVTVTPTNGLTGVHQITVATGVYVDAVDYQVVSVRIIPEPATLGLTVAGLLLLLGGRAKRR